MLLLKTIINVEQDIENNHLMALQSINAANQAELEALRRAQEINSTFTPAFLWEHFTLMAQANSSHVTQLKRWRSQFGAAKVAGTLKETLNPKICTKFPLKWSAAT